MTAPRFNEYGFRIFSVRFVDAKTGKELGRLHDRTDLVLDMEKSRYQDMGYIVDDQFIDEEFKSE